MSKHTKEPWVAEFRNEADEMWMPDGWWEVGPATIPIGKTIADRERAKDDAQRLEACVSACTGVKDPAAFVSAVRAAVAAGAVEELHLTLIRNAMGGA